MVTEFRLPEVGEHIESATVVEVLVAPGQRVEKEQIVAVLETEKATLDVPSSLAGTVSEVKIKKGETIQVGAVLMTVEEGGEATPQPAPSTESTASTGSTAAPAKEKRAPEKKEKPEKKEAREAPEPKPEKIPEKPETPVRPDLEERILKQPDIPSGEEVEEEIKPAAARGGKVSETAPPAEEEKERAGTPAVAGGVAASPAVRRLAREIGVEIEEVKGSGPGGRVSEEDVKRHAKERAGTPALPGGARLGDLSKWGEVERQALPTIRRLTGEHVSWSWTTIPHVHQRDKADITELERLRREHNAELPSGEPKLTMTVILAKLMAGMLGRYPRFNASVDGTDLVLKKYVNIGIAVDTERGLLVPVLRDVNKKSVRTLAAELDEMAARARAGKLAPEQMQGGTFTISNLGGIGGTSFDPIVNAPEVAILGVARAAEEVVPVGGQPAVRLMLPLTLGYDHRAIDGAEGARFLREAAAALGNPFGLLIEI